MIAAALHLSLLGVELRLAHPERWPWSLGAVVVGLVVGTAFLRRRRGLLLLTASGPLRDLVAPTASTSRWLLRRAASLLALALLSLALLRPQLGEKEVMVERRGIDLVVAVDASRSMLARDVLPSRLERAKLELASLIDGLRGDRVGIVVFAGEAFVQCPLTYDRGAAKLFLRAIDPGTMPSQGTAIGKALETAGALFQASEGVAKSRVVLLLSDGEDHSGSVERAAASLAEQGVRVYALGIGSEAGTPIPILDAEGRVQGYQKDRRGRTVVSRREDDQLERIAAKTGGRFFAASGGGLGVGEILGELSRLETTEREGRLALEWEEAYHLLALPGLILLVLGAGWTEGRRRG